MTKLTVVIPHWGRDELLFWHLKELNKQTHKDFDVIVVLDEDHENYDTGYGANLEWQIEQLGAAIDWSDNAGPGEARNIGARLSKSDIILVLGSDCIPDRNLIARHVYEHSFSNIDICQGITPWHSDVITPFYHFIDTSGLQAAWGNIKDKNDNWIRDISPSFCLTTNWSIKRQLLLNEPFDKRLDGPAWDDVELGYRLAKYGDAIRQVFSPDAVNYHYHRYDFDSFLARSRMEGYNRIKMCKIHPEMGWNLTNPHELRIAAKTEEKELVLWAKELDNLLLGNNVPQNNELRKIKYQRYTETCKTFSLLGVLDRIKDEHPAMQALQHVHSNEQVIQILSGVNALEMGHTGYAMHCAQWFVAERSDDWSAHAFLGEIELEANNIDSAIEAFKKSLIINPKGEWAKKRLAKLQGMHI